MLTDVKRFFEEAKPLDQVPQEKWFAPGKLSAPKVDLFGHDLEALKERVVLLANRTLVAANHRAGEYSRVFFSFQSKGRRRDPETGQVMPHAELRLLVLE